MKKYGYTIFVVLIMIALPLLSGWIELARSGNDSIIEVFGRWFVFWGIGVRLFTSGVNQIFGPNRTSQGILGVQNKGAWQLVRELGFANLGIGIVGITSLWYAGWTTAAALAGGIFLLFAGIEHIRKANHNLKETTAMVTDLLVGAIAITYLAIVLI